jgi:chaperonin GroES
MAAPEQDEQSLAMKEVAATVLSDDGYALDITPLGSRILVEREKEKKTAGGIIVPEDQQDHALCGVVVATGAGAELLSVGDRVMFARYSGREVQYDLPMRFSSKCLAIYLMDESDVTCLMHERKVGK